MALGVLLAVCLLQGPMQQRPSRDNDVQLPVGLAGTSDQVLILLFNLFHRGKEWQN